MKTEFTKDWCMSMAELEADSEIGAGLVAIDPVFDGESAAVKSAEESVLAFSRFVQFARRNRGLTVETLAEKADVEVSELVTIEEDGQYKPDLRTVYQLANFFGVRRANLLQVAGLIAPKDVHIINEAVRFAARSESVAALTAEERAALDVFVSVLSEQK
jgi:HTH-type transcriptional regulator, competence development regulator